MPTEPETLTEAQRQVFAERLAGELGAGQVTTGAPCAAYAIQGLAPVAVARPATLDELAAALRLAAEAGAAVAPWGNGSRMALGYPPARLDLVVSLERMNRVVRYDPADLTITVEAGMTHARLAEALAPARQMLPLDPPLPARATIGGTLATGLVGLRRGLYGGPRELALAMRVIDAAGEIAVAGGAVVKNSTGYGMTRLYVGSLGTLCMIAEASFKLAPQPEAEATILATTSSSRQTLAAAQAIRALAVQPASVVAMSRDALPELTRLTPDPARSELLAIRLPGNEAAVRRAVAEAEAALAHVGAQPLMTLQDAAAHAEFWASANDFAALRAHAREALVRVNTPPSDVAEALDTAAALTYKHALRLGWLADLATGTLWLRLSPEDAAGDDAFAAALGATLASLIQRWGLVTTLSCPPPLKRGLPLWGDDPASAALMREVKRRFDPDHRLNPGRYAAGI
ncbi:MAG: FAD-binding oxidoreductase [Chloroflexota bacterium]|nr:FAD-binding oxidoreductase [Chloroflexota bacterium]